MQVFAHFDLKLLGNGRKKIDMLLKAKFHDFALDFLVFHLYKEESINAPFPNISEIFLKVHGEI